MTTREAFLAHLRSRLAAGIPDNPIRPTLALDDPRHPPVIEYAVSLDDRVARFTSALEALFGHVGTLEEAIAAEGVQTAVVSRDPECDGVAARLEAAGVRIIDDPATADLGVTGARHGVALTGSLVVDSTRAGSRVKSLLPPVHVARLPVASIVATPGDVLRSLPDRELPSNLVFITGPSRSADIELQITLGVHGPRSLWVELC